MSYADQRNIRHLQYDNWRTQSKIQGMADAIEMIGLLKKEIEVLHGRMSNVEERIEDIKPINTFLKEKEEREAQ